MAADNREWIRAIAIRVAVQLAEGLLDEYPLDKGVAERQLRLYVKAGDITWKELEKYGYFERGLVNSTKKYLCTIIYPLLGRLLKRKGRVAADESGKNHKDSAIARKRVVDNPVK